MKKNTIRTLIAVGSASLALVAAGPASAQDAKPLDPNGKPMCGKTTSDGETRWFRQGETIKETDVDGKTTTKKCSTDGKWVVVPAAGMSPTGAFGGISGTSGTYQAGPTGTSVGYASTPRIGTLAQALP